ncbi:MAG: OmpP1/FadL family transporter [Alphaproteobacteria bacterium]
MSSIRGMAAILLLSSLAAAPAARAAGFYIKEHSAQGLGRAFAGVSAYAPDASAVFFNPAALTQLEEVTATSSVYGLILDSEQQNNGTVRTVPGLDDPVPVPGTPGDNPFDPLIPLGNFYIAGPADDDGLYVGLGVTSPFGLNVKYNGDFFGRFDSLKSLLFTMNVQPTIAYKITDNISVGAGLDIQYAEVTLTNALPNLDPALGDGFFRVEGDDWNLSWNAGIHADLGNLQLGAHYRASVDYLIKGEATIRGLFGPLEPVNGFFEAAAPLTLPDIVSGGLVYSVPETGFRLLFDVTWFDWSDFDEIRIDLAPGLNLGMPQNYDDTWSFALGGEYDINENFTVRAGTQYDQTPTRDGFRTTRVPDGDRWWAAAGLSFRLSDRYSVDLSYAHVFVTNELIDVTEAFFEGTPAEVLVRTRSRNRGEADLVALGLTAQF